MPPSSHRLDGKRVVVTRVVEPGDALAIRLRQLGAELLPFPATMLGPPEELAPLDQALGELERFDAVAFASVHAVERTVARMAELGIPLEALAARRLAAVGSATAGALRRSVRAPDLVPTEATGAALGAALAMAAKGRHILIPRPAYGRPEIVEVLLAAGAEVVAPAAYRTLPVPPERLRPLGDLIEQGRVDAIAFAAPSAVRSVASALGDRAGLVARVCVAVIGPTTADAARAAGWPVSAQPPSASAAALADAIAERLAAP